MAVISDGHGGYLDTSTGAPVDAQGQPIVAGQVPGLPGYTRDSLAKMLGIPATDPRIDQYMKGETPQGGWSLQQIAQEVSKQTPVQQAAQLGAGGYIDPHQAALVNQVNEGWKQPGAITTDQRILSAIGMLSGQGNQNASAYNALAASTGDTTSAGQNLPSVGANRVINATQGMYDPYRQAAEALNAGKSPEEVWSGLGQAAAMYGNHDTWFGDLTLDKIKQISSAMGTHGITPIGPQGLGGGGGSTPPVTTDPNAGNAASTAISNQIRNNWMNSPIHNPGGINTYAIQNMKQDDLTKGMAGGGADTSTYQPAGQNYDPTAAGTGGNAFGGIQTSFNNTANSGGQVAGTNQSAVQPVAGQITPGTQSTTEAVPPPPPVVTTTGTTNPSGGNSGGDFYANQGLARPDSTTTYTPGVNTVRSYFGQ